jgi:acetoin:2,6-dichlorophenolindophenol oxidoreductase subunit alpha
VRNIGWKRHGRNKMQLDDRKISELFRNMQMVRHLEKRLGELVISARVPCSGHFGLGQEAVGVGVTGALEREDYLFGTHRGFAEYIGKGMTPKEILAEYYGKATSLSGGRLGQHLLKPEAGIMPLPSSLGSEFGLSVGCALSSMRLRKGAVTLNLFGEGTASQPDCAAALEMAALWQLPLIFACSNNQYVELDRFSNLSPSTKVAPRAAAYCVPSETVDGNDVAAVWEATARAVERARGGRGPTFLEFETYRRSTHYTGDAGGYQPAEEVRLWEKKDPIDRCRTLLRARGLLAEEDEKKLLQEIAETIEEAVTFAEESPLPEAPSTYTDVYA